MSHNDAYNVPIHKAHIYRQDSLPTYEEATGIETITDYTEIALEVPRPVRPKTGNQQYIINIYNNQQGHSQTTNISDNTGVSRNGDRDMLSQENHIRAVDSLSQTCLLRARRRQRVRRQKNELRQIIYIGAFFLFSICMITVCLLIKLYGESY